MGHHIVDRTPTKGNQPQDMQCESKKHDGLQHRILQAHR